jgi:hypothetical protein
MERKYDRQLIKDKKTNARKEMRIKKVIMFTIVFENTKC